MKNSLDKLHKQIGDCKEKDKGQNFRDRWIISGWSNMCVIQVLEREEGKDEAGKIYN